MDIIDNIEVLKDTGLIYWVGEVIRYDDSAEWLPIVWRSYIKN